MFEKTKTLPMFSSDKETHCAKWFQEDENNIKQYFFDFNNL